MILKEPIRQIGYYVENVREAATRHHELFGSGPYFIAENARMQVEYRGKNIEQVNTAAFGQWGAVQLEIIQGLPDGPDRDVFRELYPKGSGRYGVHHVTIIVDDFDASLAVMEAAGFEVALRLHIEKMDAPSVMLDALDTYGHFIELYPGVQPMVDFYDMVADAAKNFDGKQLFHDVQI